MCVVQINIIVNSTIMGKVECVFWCIPFCSLHLWQYYKIQNNGSNRSDNWLWMFNGLSFVYLFTFSYKIKSHHCSPINFTQKFHDIFQILNIFGSKWTTLLLLLGCVAFLVYAFRNYLRQVRLALKLRGPKTIPLIGNALIMSNKNGK